MSVASRSAGPRPERSRIARSIRRGLRFAAWVTTVVLAVVLLTRSTPLLAVQTVIFVIGAARRPSIRAIRFAVPLVGPAWPPAARSATGTRARGAAPLRTSDGRRLCDHRRHRVRRRSPGGRPDRYGVGARGSVPECSFRFLPRLRNLPLYFGGRAFFRPVSPPVPERRRSSRRARPFLECDSYEPRRRPRRRRLGSRPS